MECYKYVNTYNFNLIFFTIHIYFYEICAKKNANLRSIAHRGYVSGKRRENSALQLKLHCQIHAWIHLPNPSC